MLRSAEAVWRGSGLEGGGNITTPSGVMKDQPYSAKLRFVDESGVNGTNPEELIAAAHAGCFSMALSFRLSGAGHAPDEIRTKAEVTLLKNADGSGWSVTGIALKCQGKVPGITAEQFAEHAEAAKNGCPISRALSVPITIEAKFIA
jgi:osmotically inducible protein OsmC